MNENEDGSVPYILPEDREPKHLADEEKLSPDPGNSPPECWTEDMTPDEVDAVVEELQVHEEVEKMRPQSEATSGTSPTPKEES